MRKLVFHELCAAPSRYAYEISFTAFAEILDAALERSGPWGLQHAWTFDDGYQSDLAASELLWRRRLSGFFFLTVGWIGTRPGFLSWDEARAIVKRGHRIGSHGWTHRLLPRLSDSELELELARSREFLQDQLNVPVETLAAPGGRWNPRVAAAAARAGYTTLMTNEAFGIDRRVAGLDVSGRLTVRQGMRPARAADYVVTDAPLLAERLQGAARRTARTVLGDRAYRRLFSGRRSPDFSGAGTSAPAPDERGGASRRSGTHRR